MRHDGLDDGLGGLSAETEAVLRRARAGEAMPPARRRRLKGAVLARLAFTSTATVAAGQATSAAMGLAAKVVVGLAVAGSIGAGVTLAVRPRHDQVEARAVATSPAPRVAAAEPPSVEPPSVEPPAVAAPVIEPAPRHAHVRHAPERRAAPSSTLAAETTLLRDADRAARAGDTATALARLDEHAARFPDGALAPERAAERLIVLCDLSAGDPRAVAQFLASHAGSPLAARVRRACAPKP